jgi:hypothetical protein
VGLLLAILIVAVIGMVQMFQQASRMDPPASAAPPSAVEVEVAGRSYTLRPGETATVTSPKGERIPITLKLRETLHFSGYGMAFDYPGVMRVAAEKDDDFATVTVDGPDSPLVLFQSYGPAYDVEDIRTALREQFVKEFSGDGKSLTSEREVKRRIGGVERTGTALDFNVAGDSIAVELYAWDKGLRVMTAVFQWRREDQALADRTFNVVTGSYK